MSALTQLSVPEEARPLKIAPEAIYTSSFLYFSQKIVFQMHTNFRKNIQTEIKHRTISSFF